MRNLTKFLTAGAASVLLAATAQAQELSIVVAGGEATANPTDLNAGVVPEDSV